MWETAKQINGGRRHDSPMDVHLRFCKTRHTFAANIVGRSGEQFLDFLSGLGTERAGKSHVGSTWSGWVCHNLLSDAKTSTANSQYARPGIHSFHVLALLAAERAAPLTSVLRIALAPSEEEKPTALSPPGCHSRSFQVSAHAFIIARDNATGRLQSPGTGLWEVDSRGTGMCQYHVPSQGRQASNTLTEHYPNHAVAAVRRHCDGSHMRIVSKGGSWKQRQREKGMYSARRVMP